VGAAEALEVGEDGGSALGVGLDVVVLQEGRGVAAGLAAFGVDLVEDALLAAGGESASGAGVDGPVLVVVEQERDEGFGQ
jgi:hypothetical protein